MNYQAEGSTAVHSFNGNRVDILGGLIPTTPSNKISFFVNGGNAYGAWMCSSAPTNYKNYDICNESGNFSIRRTTDSYNGLTGTLLSYTTSSLLTLGDSASSANALYGAISIRGSRNLYSGINFANGFGNPVFMQATDGGINGMWSHSQAVNSWNWHYNTGNFIVFNYGANTEGTHLGLFKGLGSLPGYPNNRHPTVRTDYPNLYFSAGGAFSAFMSTAGVWSAVSDYYQKEIIEEEIDGNAVLEKIKHLPIARYCFKSESSEIQRIGTFAQAFWLAFQCGGSDENVVDDSPTSPNKQMAVADVVGVCLAAIKELINRVENLSE